MTVTQLNKLTRELIEQGHWNTDVAIDTGSIMQDDDAEIERIESGEIMQVSTLDGPRREKCAFLVLRGGYVDSANEQSHRIPAK
jgi:hypothetical protein